MIAHLRGTLLEAAAEGRTGSGDIIVDCGGVGYDVTLSAASLGRLPPVGEPVALRIYTHALENRLALYGFVTREERELFDALITVKGVGPATAVDILSAAPSNETLAGWISASDAAALVRLKGVGKKTAELLVVELRERATLMLASWRARGVAAPEVARTPSVGGRPAILEDVASALLNMSFRSVQVDQVLERMTVVDGATVEALLRDALKELRDLQR